MTRLLGALAVLVLCAAQAHAVCAGKITGVSAQTALTYSPFAPWSAIQRLTLSVQNTGTASCAFQLSVPASSYPLLLGGKLNFSIEGAGGATTSNGLFSALTPSISASQTVVIPFSIIVARGQAVTSGTLSGQATFILTAANASAGQPTVDQVIVPLSCIVPPVFELSIAGSGQSATFQLGQLAANETATVILNTRATGNHTLEFHSQNHGYLVAKSAVGHATPIPYSITIDGSPLPLSEASDPKYTAGPGLASRRLTITIGPMSGAVAGTYSDTVSVNVTSFL